MANYTINISWSRNTPDFSYKTYNRDHEIVFSGGNSLGTSAPAEYLGNSALANPEELLIASVSSCFMLTFQALSAMKGLILDSYTDQSTGVVAKNADGKMAVTEITLKPQIIFKDNKNPAPEVLNELFEKSHSNCFISNSIKTKIIIQPEVTVD